LRRSIEIGENLEGALLEFAFKWLENLSLPNLDAKAPERKCWLRGIAREELLIATVHCKCKRS